MLHAISQISVLAVVLANVFAFVLGGIWFAVLFPKTYATVLGRTFDPKQKPSPLFIVGPFFCNLVASLTSAVLIALLGINSIPGALAFGALIGIGYVLSTTLNIAINPNFPHPFLYTALNAPYFLVVSLVSSVLLVVLA